MEMSDMEVTPDSEDDEEGISLRSKREERKSWAGKVGAMPVMNMCRAMKVCQLTTKWFYGSWTRSECFKIRAWSTYIWIGAVGKRFWKENQFRKGWSSPVVEDCARIICSVLFTPLQGVMKKIRNFIWDPGGSLKPWLRMVKLQSQEIIVAYITPSPRGRMQRKKNRMKDIPKAHDTQEMGRFEIIGARLINMIVSSMGMRVPRGVDSAPPRVWWDTECDVSLTRGYIPTRLRNYLAMRSDPQLLLCRTSWVPPR
ncbi:unnamed protein product [Danaus chrysippus]|uniref:(African queen) hypothetical protein n=1 Tax=Danaus chrysippus TaxID=151541 RepID=A0A8J2QQY5_9NEOP|nr:unnamed protein product [Danaus chrysippus]